MGRSRTVTRVASVVGIIRRLMYTPNPKTIGRAECRLTLRSSALRFIRARRVMALAWVCLLLGLVLTSGCASLMRNASAQIADQLTIGISSQEDPEIAKAGIPAYLLALDGMIASDPKAIGLRRAGAELYGAYAGAFVTDPQRARALADKAHRYAVEALCLEQASLCAVLEAPYERFEAAVGASTAATVPAMYALASAWAGRIAADTASTDRIAEIPRVKLLIERVVALDPGHRDGDAHMVLGALEALLPPAVGGQPERSQAAFERALALSKGRNLMVKVIYAERYARLMFEQELHDRLLAEVLEAPLEPGSRALVNAIAKQRAALLAESAKDYF